VNRRRSLLVLAAVLAGGCQAERPAAPPAPAPAPAPAAAVPVLPAAWAGIWRSEAGAVLVVGGDLLLWTEDAGAVAEWRPRAVRAIGPALVLELAEGTAALTPGRAVRERRLVGQAVWADAEHLDLHRSGRATVRLWRDGGLTWLPVQTPAAAAGPLAADPDARLRERARDLADPGWAAAAEALVGAARAGARSDELAARIDATVRRERLAALDRLEASIADPALRPAADRLAADADAWLAHATAWLESRP
jgi:hypothetical protein